MTHLRVPARIAAALPRLGFSQLLQFSKPLNKAYYGTGNMEGLTEDEVNIGREWLSRFNSSTLPRDIGDISFSRSSGPGGQNVNKYVGPSLTVASPNSPTDFLKSEF